MARTGDSITNYVSVNTELATSVIPSESFGVTLFLGCDETVGTIGTVPIDRRLITVTAEDFAGYLDSDSEEYRFATTYFGQPRKPDYLKIGRVVGADTAPYTVLGDANLDYTDYTLLNKAILKFSDNAGTPNVVQLSNFSLTSCTSWSDWLSVVNGKLAALTNPAIDGLELCVFFLDNLGRLAFSSPHVKGSSARTIKLVAATEGSGEVDLFDALYLGTDQDIYGGSDAETITDALEAIRLKDDVFYPISVYHDFTGDAVGIADADYLELATYIATQKNKLLSLVIYDADAKDSQESGDLATALHDLAIDNLIWYYTENTDECPDAANHAMVFTMPEGQVSFAEQKLALVTESGNPDTLTAEEKTAIMDKGGNYIASVSPYTFAYPGLVVSGKEARHVFGCVWMDSAIQISIMNARMSSDVPFTYDYQTFTIIEGILRQWLNEAAARNIIYASNDPNYPFSITMPDPSDFDAAEKATHEFDRRIYYGTVKSEILRWGITGKFTI